MSGPAKLWNNIAQTVRALTVSDKELVQKACFIARVAGTGSSERSAKSTFDNGAFQIEHYATRHTAPGSYRDVSSHVAVHVKWNGEDALTYKEDNVGWGTSTLESKPGLEWRKAFLKLHDEIEKRPARPQARPLILG